LAKSCFLYFPSHAKGAGPLRAFIDTAKELALRSVP
jgi:hypothetical protein